MQKMKRTSTTALIAIALALPFALSSCSSGGDDADATPRAGDGIGAKWSACMRDAGLDVADATDDEVTSGAFTAPDGVDQSQFLDQARTCAQHVGAKAGDDATKQQYERQYDAVASCIRDHGFEDLPEQQPGVLDFSSYDRSTDPEFDSVATGCIEEFAPDTKFQGK